MDGTGTCDRDEGRGDTNNSASSSSSSGGGGSGSTMADSELVQVFKGERRISFEQYERLNRLLLESIGVVTPSKASKPN
jgi:hypothetical protein